MEYTDNPSLRETVRNYLANAGDDTLTWVETHGLLTAVACGPELDAPRAWLALISDGNTFSDDVIAALEGLLGRIRSALGAGEHIQLPCRLDPYAEQDGQDLQSWCTGFMGGVFLQESRWYEQDEARVVDLLLPFLLISGLYEDDEPDMDALWDNSQLVRQMANSLPELLEELFLLFNAPDAPTGEADDETDDDGY